MANPLTGDFEAGAPGKCRHAIGLGMTLAGAAGNLTDAFTHGAVVYWGLSQSPNSLSGQHARYYSQLDLTATPNPTATPTHGEAAEPDASPMQNQ